jgi:hypothetical protein
MTAPAAIQGDFCTFRHVQGRKVLQIIIEVPAEAAGTVFATLGMPGSGEGVPVALARLVAAPEPTHTTPEPGKVSSDTGPVTRRFSDLPYSQQAAMRCGEQAFHDFIADCHHDWLGAQNATQSVRDHCGVQSRAEIIKGTPAGDKWAALEAEYYAWSRGMR